MGHRNLPSLYISEYSLLLLSWVPLLVTDWSNLLSVYKDDPNVLLWWCLHVGWMMVYTCWMNVGVYMLD